MRSSVEFLTKGNAGIVNLNRPKALNALNHEMVKLMRPQLDKWKEIDFNTTLALILLLGILPILVRAAKRSSFTFKFRKNEEFALLIIKGEGGKAFCAGGDIKDFQLIMGIILELIFSVKNIN